MNAGLEQFSEIFKIILDYHKTRDESGQMARMYFGAVAQIGATYQELWQFTEAHLNCPPSNGMPSIRDIKSAILATRPAPPPPQESERPTEATDLRSAKIAVLRGIYRHQGDTKFYRRMLSDNPDPRFAAFLRGLPDVTHEDVLASCATNPPPKLPNSFPVRAAR